METRLFRLDSYLGPQDHFHLAHKELQPARPDFLHRHDYYELFLVAEGATRHWINGRGRAVGRGTICFVRPDDSHAFQAIGPRVCRIWNVMFRTATAEHLARRYGAELGARFFWKSGDEPETFALEGPRLERAINSLVELQHARKSRLTIEQFLLYVMTRVIDHNHVPPEGAPAWLGRACSAARSPDVFRDGVPAFVRAAGRGHEHVSRVTRRFLGVSPTAYLTRIRMEHAAQLLAAADTPIPEVAEDCGIANISHFYKSFRRIYGTTPRKYRITHRKDPIQHGIG